MWDGWNKSSNNDIDEDADKDPNTPNTPVENGGSIVDTVYVFITEISVVGGVTEYIPLIGSTVGKGFHDYQHFKITKAAFDKVLAAPDGAKFAMIVDISGTSEKDASIFAANKDSYGDIQWWDGANNVVSGQLAFGMSAMEFQGEPGSEAIIITLDVSALKAAFTADIPAAGVEVQFYPNNFDDYDTATNVPPATEAAWNAAAPGDLTKGSPDHDAIIWSVAAIVIEYASE